MDPNSGSKRGDESQPTKNGISGTKRRWSNFNRRNTLADLYAGFVQAAVSIPDGMASGLLAGVNPVFGLSSLIIGTPIAAFFTGSVFMSISSTGAMSIIVGSLMANYQGDAQINALVTVVLVVGIVQLAAGLLRLGFMTRFVSTAVMTGFFNGICILIALSQLSNLTGYQSEYSNRIVQTIDLVLNIKKVDSLTTITGLISILLIIMLARTRLRSFSYVAVVILITAFVWKLNLDTVQTVEDISQKAPGLPRPFLPIPLFDWNLIVTGVAVAIVGLLQGAGISSNYPNPDGKNPDHSRDFLGQGAANLAVAWFRGIPVGGSISSTALMVASGAKSRLANIFTGVWAVIIVLLMANLIKLLPLTTLAAILIVVGIQGFNLERIRTVWETGLVPRIVMLITFTLLMVFPIYIAVFIAVVIQIILYIFRSSDQVKIVQLLRHEDGKYEELTPPPTLPDKQITLLMPIGSLFFAGAANMETKLPSAENSESSVVILRLRGRDEVGSTFLFVVSRYAHKLQQHNGKLVLVGVSENVYKQLKRTRVLASLGDDNVYPATFIRRESLEAAEADARAWLAEKQISE